MDSINQTTTTGGGVRISDSPRYEDTNGISVSRAEEEFNALSRQLTARSELGNGFEKSVSTVDVKQKDIEKGDEEKDRFDLRDYLSSSNDAHQSAGIKHKVRPIRYIFMCIPSDTRPFCSTSASLGRICKSKSSGAPTAR